LIFLRRGLVGGSLSYANIFNVLRRFLLVTNYFVTKKSDSRGAIPP
jgi:hypothetical protein